MSSVEAAASLFGPEESSDPFATLGSDNAFTSPSITGSSFNDHETNIPEPSLDSGDHLNALPLELNPSAAAPSYSEPATFDQHGYHAPSHSQDMNSTSTTTGYDSIQGWYDEHGQWHAYEQPVAETLHSGQGHTDAQDYPTPSIPYDPYAPQVNHLPSSYDTQHGTQAQLSYDPYNPRVQTSSNSYNPPSVPASQHTYDPYRPNTSNFQQPSVSQAPAYSYPTSLASKPTPALPPPRAQVAALNRPKISNAYDPPFPMSKPARRPPARSVPPAAGVYGQQYPVYGSVPTVPLGHPNTSLSPEDTAGMGLPQQAHPAPSHPSANFDDVQTQFGNVGGKLSRSQNLHPDAPLPWTSPQTTLGDRRLSDTQPPSTTVYSLPQSTSSYTEASALVRSDDILGTTRADAFSSSPHSNSVSSDGFSESYATSMTSISYGEISPRSQSFQRSTHQDVGFTTQSEAGVLASPPNLSYEPSEPLVSDNYSNHPADRMSSSRPSTSHSHTDSGGSERYAIPQNPNFVAYVSEQRTLSPDSIPETLTNGAQSHRQAQIGAPNSYQSPPTVPREHVSSLPMTQAHRDPTTGVPDPYKPKVDQPHDEYDTSYISGLDGTTSPPSQGNAWSGSKAYSPPMGNGDHIQNRFRSNSSVHSLVDARLEDPYAPSHHVRYQPSDSSEYGSYGYNQSHVHDARPLKAPSVTSDPLGQELLVSTVPQTLYAPSPSLLGLNDPLGRTAARVPVFSFGFGGKLVTCFHGSSVLNTGFDVALSSRRSMDVNIRVLSKIIPESALDTSTSSFPGPLFCDPGTPTVSLVRTGTAVKTQKARVINYLTQRVEEISRGIGYLHPGTVDRRNSEAKLVLVKLLKVMVENNGSLSGTPQIDVAVRAALVPRLEMSSGAPVLDATSSTPVMAFSLPADTVPSRSSFSYRLAIAPSTSQETPIAVSTLYPSTVDKIQEFLLRGERQKAYHFALDEKLWAHAMVISSSIDKEAWKEVVNEFVKTELGGLGRNADTASKPDGRESLRVAYSMFSGQGAAAVQELLPQNLLSRTTSSLQGHAPSHMPPISPNFSAVAPLQATNIPVESLSKWTETAAMMLSAAPTVETSSALTALGDYLWSNQWVEAAHACYLLAPQTSPMGGVGVPTTRIILLGSPNPANYPSFHKDTDPIIFTEIVEFALSLASPAKGQDVFNGLPHLQAYRLIRANALAEVGEVQLASRYCEAITAALHRSSPYFTITFVEQLKWLSDRIVGAPHIEKSGSWIGGKMSKPSLDSIGTWLEGRFTKLITGDQSPLPSEHVAASEDRTFSGPFSHYSAISSATSSASPSPQPSAINMNVFPPPRRSGSAMAYPLAPNSHVQIDRASSAMDYVRRKPSPTPRIASANAATTTFAQAPAFGSAVNHYGSLETPRPPLDTKEHARENEEATWWGASYVSDSTQTPTATTFVRLDEPRDPSSPSEFVSLMDNEAFPVIPANKTSKEVHHHDDEELEDLGFGNSSKREKPPNGDHDEPLKTPSTEKAEPAKDVPAEQTEPTKNSGSWFGRFGLWGKRETTSGPIKASLGEEKTFYYDKELKRWVNKAESGTPPKSADPPPPPSRAQTTSPGRSGAFPSGTSTNSGPPTRPASAIDLSTSQPTKSVVRVRSNLVPTESLTPPTASSSNAPPPARPRSQAAKRNIRSRYVDVLQQDGASQ